VRRQKRAVRIDPIVFGGGQERGLRSGTLNVSGIVGMGEAARLASENLQHEIVQVRAMRDDLWRLLRERIDRISLNGPALDDLDVRLPNNLNVQVAGVDGHSLLATLAGAGLAVSSGSACSSENPRPSHVLRAIGLNDDEARASLRFGLSRFTTREEIVEAVAVIAAGVARLRG